MRAILLFLFLIGLLSCKSGYQKAEGSSIAKAEKTYFAEIEFPKQTGNVNDFENVFTEMQKFSLEQYLSGYENLTTNEIAIITVSSIDPYKEIQVYGKDLGNAWGLGKNEMNNGLLIVLNISSREVGISTGLGTEKILTDEICAQIIENHMIPEFKKGDYYAGIVYGLEEITAIWGE
jgi:uncharacterized protein